MRESRARGFSAVASRPSLTDGDVFVIVGYVVISMLLWAFVMTAAIHQTSSPLQWKNMSENLLFNIPQRWKAPLSWRPWLLSKIISSHWLRNPYSMILTVEILLRSRRDPEIRVGARSQTIRNQVSPSVTNISSAYLSLRRLGS